MGMNLLIGVEHAGTSGPALPAALQAQYGFTSGLKKHQADLRQFGCQLRRAPSSSGSYPRLTQPTWTFWASKTELALSQHRRVPNSAGTACFQWGWRYCRNNPSLSTFPIVRVAGGWKCGDHNMQDERGKHLNHLKQSLQGKPGSQEPHSALCHPPMVLKWIFFFFLVFLTLRRWSHCWRHPAQDGAEPDLAELWHLAGHRAGAAPPAAPCLSFAAGTAVLAPWTSSSAGLDSACGEHQDPHTKLSRERLCCTLCDGLGKHHSSCWSHRRNTSELEI